MHYDVIVAGLGAMGSAALDRLAAHGARVLGIERFGVPSSNGSSVGDTRLIRRAYFEHPDYVPLLDAAYAGWRDLEDRSGERLLFQTGTLYFGHPDSDLVAGSRRAADVHGIPLEALDDGALRERFPQFRRPEDYVALFEPEAGFLLCEQAVRAQVGQALRNGARIIVGERVVEWHAVGDGILVQTDRGSYSAGALVLTLGSWSAGLLEGLNLPLQVTRQPMFWIWPRGHVADLEGIPCWAADRPDVPGLLYGFPALTQGVAHLGNKVAHHAPGAVVDPDAELDAASAGELASILASAAPFLPAIQGTMTGAQVCKYTMSADGHFVVDAHPGHANMVFGCGFSGHGFKFAPAIGRALADLALEGRTPLPIGFLAMRPFPSAG